MICPGCQKEISDGFKICPHCNIDLAGKEAEKAEAPVEEVTPEEAKTEAPAEEAKTEAPAEEAKTEETPEETPTQEAPAEEEKKDEAPSEGSESYDNAPPVE